MKRSTNYLVFGRNYKPAQNTSATLTSAKIVRAQLEKQIELAFMLAIRNWQRSAGCSNSPTSIFQACFTISSLSRSQPRRDKADFAACYSPKTGIETGNNKQLFLFSILQLPVAATELDGCVFAAA